MDLKEAEQRLLVMLARRDMSRQAAQQALTRMGVPCDEQTGVLERMVAWGYLNDARYADALAQRRAAQGRGPRRLALEYRQKGLADSGATEGIDWQANARALWQRRFGDRPAADARERARRIRFMLGRGFSMAHIQACMDPQALDDVPEDLSADD